MGQEGFVEIVCVLDRSGSMSSIKEDAIGGFNTFLEEQKKQEGGAKLTLVLFDTEYKVIHNGINIQDVEPLNEDTYVPRACTALLDAMGRAITTVKEKYDNTQKEHRPKGVIVCTLTDGMENSSREYNHKQIMDMISEREKDGWEFMFLAANQDAIQTGASLGLRAANCVSFAHNSAGVKMSYRAMSDQVTGYRSSCSVSRADSSEEENA